MRGMIVGGYRHSAQENLEREKTYLLKSLKFVARESVHT